GMTVRGNTCLRAGQLVCGSGRPAPAPAGVAATGTRSVPTPYPPAHVASAPRAAGGSRCCSTGSACPRRGPRPFYRIPAGFQRPGDGQERQRCHGQGDVRVPGVVATVLVVVQ